MTRKDATLVGIGEQRIGHMQRTRSGLLKLFRPRNRSTGIDEAAQVQHPPSVHRYPPTYATMMWQSAGLGIAAVLVAGSFCAFLWLLLS